MTNSTWWYLTRASGLTAWVFLTLTVLWGAIASGRLVQRRGARRWLLDLHPYLGGIGLGALVLHVVGAVADTFVQLRWIDIVVPFTSGWNRTGVSLGVVALWSLLAVEATSIARRRLSRPTWRRFHLLSYVMAWTVCLHAATTGTDLRNPVVAWGALALVAATTGVVTGRALAPTSSAAPA